MSESSESFDSFGDWLLVRGSEMASLRSLDEEEICANALRDEADATCAAGFGKDDSEFVADGICTMRGELTDPKPMPAKSAACSSVTIVYVAGGCPGSAVLTAAVAAVVVAGFRPLVVAAAFSSAFDGEYDRMRMTTAITNTIPSATKNTGRNGSRLRRRKAMVTELGRSAAIIARRIRLDFR